VESSPYLTSNKRDKKDKSGFARRDTNMKMNGEKAEKMKTWAKRLECPVDEDAGYHNTFVSR
jgi:hypothetical protein